MAAEWEDDHPTQRSLPAVRLSEIRETRREAPLEGPPTIPSSPPFPSFRGEPAELADEFVGELAGEFAGEFAGDAPEPRGSGAATSRPLSLARPTLVSPSDAPEVEPHAGDIEPSTVPSALLPRIPPPPRAPSELAQSLTGEALLASAALPLVAVGDDHRATVETPVAPAALSSICALERQLLALRRRTIWLAALCALSLALSLTLAVIVALSR